VRDQISHPYKTTVHHRRRKQKYNNLLSPYYPYRRHKLRI
jgi:hypothetical protein